MGKQREIEKDRGIQKEKKRTSYSMNNAARERERGITPHLFSSNFSPPLLLPIPLLLPPPLPLRSMAERRKG